MEAINARLLTFLGELNYGKAGIMFIPELASENKGVFKVNNRFLNESKATLTLIKTIKNDDVIVKTITVSGSLNKAKEKLKGG